MPSWKIYVENREQVCHNPVGYTDIKHEKKNRLGKNAVIFIKFYYNNPLIKNNNLGVCQKYLESDLALMHLPEFAITLSFTD